MPLLAAATFFISSGDALAQGTVVGGSGNSATGKLSVVTGGFGNKATATNAVIVGGNSCSAAGQRSVVVGGTKNKTTAGGEGGVVVTGNLNTSSANNGAVLTGRSNTAAGVNSGVLAGSENRTSGLNSVVVAGEKNDAEGEGSAVVAGGGNTASGLDSVVLSGADNRVSGARSVVIGGRNSILGAADSALYATDINLASGSGIIYLGDNSRGGTEKAEAFNDNQLIGRFANGFQFFASSSDSTPDFTVDSSGVNAGGKRVSVGEESLRLLRGHVQANNANIIAGSGFTATRNGTGAYTITFDTPFSSEATPTATAFDAAGGEIATVHTLSASSFSVQITDENANDTDSNFTFQVAGPR